MAAWAYFKNTPPNPKFIAHHGIKGQKWGIRRFQNEDGSYTEEGKRRYGMYDYSKERRNRLYTDTNRMRASQRFKDAKNTVIYGDNNKTLTDSQKEEKAYEILKEGNKTDALRSYWAYKAEVEYGKQAMKNLAGLASFMTLGVGVVQTQNNIGDFYKRKYEDVTRQFIEELELQDKIDAAKKK